MEREHKARLLARLEALKQAVEEHEIPEDVLEAIYLELNRVDSLFPEGIKTHSILEMAGLGADIWGELDIEKYLREERESWERPDAWPDRA